MKSVLEDFGYSKFEIETKLIDCWNNIFDLSNKNHFYFPVENDKGYIKDTGNNDVRTEGMSYGMMMAVQMNRKDIFDRLWNWTRTYMYLSEGPNAGFFCWSNQTDGTKNSEGPAPDGEEYFAMSLFFASRRWGDGEGIYDYSTEAKNILRKAVHGPCSMWNSENHLIRFICDCPFSDPSYHLPHFYELFAEYADAEDKEFWQKAAKASREYLRKAANPVTGLVSEYAQNDGTPLPQQHHGTFYSDAYRVAANIGLDSLWCGRNAELEKIALNIICFFDQKKEFYDYLIDGTQLKRKAKHPVGLIATIAQSVGAVENRKNKELLAAAVERFWNTPMRTGRYRYYDNCLYFFAMLALSGNYCTY